MILDEKAEDVQDLNETTHSLHIWIETEPSYSRMEKASTSECIEILYEHYLYEHNGLSELVDKTSKDELLLTDCSNGTMDSLSCTDRAR